MYNNNNRGGYPNNNNQPNNNYKGNNIPESVNNNPKKSFLGKISCPGDVKTWGFVILGVTTAAAGVTFVVKKIRSKKEKAQAESSAAPAAEAPANEPAGQE